MSAVFEVSRLRKAFGGLTVTNDVSLSMAPGDRVALIGPNGAGKTTFVNLVPRHRDYDGLCYRRMGRASGGMRSWMLRAAPGTRDIKPAF
ncbi:ATP-binding cassette domain-containing protein, partial [Neorhizobium sp. P12A]|uniref:ATP-binding cassette domain-containing protein n=1 Tax=Neorhizobium sp. P12A TaxID=2268027 RepID=UPI001FEFAC30